MKLFTLTFLSFFVACIHLMATAAETSKKSKTPVNAEEEEKIEFQTEVDPSVYNPKEFQKKSGHKTKSIAEAGKPLLPIKEDREQVFAKVPGLDKEISGFDELAKDLLYARAKTRGIKELAKIYPKMPVEILTNLQNAIVDSDKTKK